MQPHLQWMQYFIFSPILYESSGAYTSLPTIRIVNLFFFNFSHLSKYIVVFICGVTYGSLMIIDMEHLFMSLFGHQQMFFGLLKSFGFRSVCLSPFGLFYNWVVFLLLSFESSLQVVYQTYYLQIFPSKLWFVFSFSTNSRRC